MRDSPLRTSSISLKFRYKWTTCPRICAKSTYFKPYNQFSEPLMFRKTSRTTMKLHKVYHLPFIIEVLFISFLALPLLWLVQKFWKELLMLVSLGGPPFSMFKMTYELCWTHACFTWPWPWLHMSIANLTFYWRISHNYDFIAGSESLSSESSSVSIPTLSNPFNSFELSKFAVNIFLNFFFYVVAYQWASSSSLYLLHLFQLNSIKQSCLCIVRSIISCIAILNIWNEQSFTPHAAGIHPGQCSTMHSGFHLKILQHPPKKDSLSHLAISVRPFPLYSFPQIFE